MAEELTKEGFPSEAVRTHPLRVLLLGGTAEATELARMLSLTAGISVISSLAGRLSHPQLPDGMVRVGGFGGASGLEAYLRGERIDVVVDATHPYAAKISSNAALACRSLSVPLIALERPQWEAQVGDCWRVMPNMGAAAMEVNREGGRVFLSVGRQELDAFCGSQKVWFLVRAIDAPSAKLPADTVVILKRGPFELENELQMLRENSINLIVSKNSGGAATYAKIEAARMLRIPVVMIARPFKHSGRTVSRPCDVLQELALIGE